MERPILMTPENAQKVHDGRKTQTRRIVKYEITGPNPPNASIFDVYDGVGPLRKWVGAFGLDGKGIERLCPYGVVGDRLWIRERFIPLRGCGQLCKRIDDATYILFSNGDQLYRKDGHLCPGPKKYAEGAWDRVKFRPAIHMPRWACRTVVELTEVRVERLNDISREDAKAEGLWPGANGLEQAAGRSWGNAQLAFQALWESIHGKDAWSLNPWVWVLGFRKV